MKITTILGARPQFIKAMPVSRRLKELDHDEMVVHTGQHYDFEMSEVFFQELGLGTPSHNLSVGSGPHGWQTAKMLSKVEALMLEQRPDAVLVYGDTNSTLAGALAACKLRIPLAHVEAGLRSFNRAMPEEHNRVLTDHCSDLLFCPTRTAVENLEREAVRVGVHLVGDTMLDLLELFGPVAEACSDALERLRLEPKGYHLATVHRPYNTDDPQRLARILSALSRLDLPVVLPVHPRTRAALHGVDSSQLARQNLRLTDPVGYVDMLSLERNAKVILTDSGGVQKEAYFLGVPCVTLRPETEWVETVDAGWNKVVDADEEEIVWATTSFAPPTVRPPAFGDGRAAARIVDVMERIGSAS